MMDELISVVEERICNVCRVRKPIDAFYLRSNKRNRALNCKSCHCEQKRTYWKANPDISKKQTAKLKDWLLVQKYGITREQFNNFIQLQHGRCNCCGVRFTQESKYRAVVDHCHDNGQHVRGIICNRCNKVEGLCESIDVARSIVKYMEQNELFSQLAK